jgi:hypothetical protein
MYYLVRLEWELEPPDSPGELFGGPVGGFQEFSRLVAGSDIPALLAQLGRAVEEQLADLVAKEAPQGSILRYWLEVQTWSSFENWRNAKLGQPPRTPLTPEPR